MADREIICQPHFYVRDYPDHDDVFCFVIMPFTDPLLEDIYKNFVKPSIESFGIRCVRGDDIFSTRSIMEDIWSTLCRCAFVVGEFTGRNPNVLYEAGIVHTLGKPLIGITQVVDDIPFDFRHIRVITYSNSPGGYNELKNRLTGTVKTLLDSERALTPRSPEELEERLSYLAQVITEERGRTQQIYAGIEERQRRHLAYFHARLKEEGVRSDAFTPIQLCNVSTTVVSVDEWDDDEKKVIEGDEITVSSFSISKYTITNTQYYEFLLDTGHYPPEHWEGSTPPPQLVNVPMVGMCWNDAQFYCEWLGDKLKAKVRLPTEAEWLAAAGYGDDRRRYVWGDSWQPNSCNSKEYGLNRHTPVDKFEHINVSPAGCVDMLGNVWEWTSTPFDPGNGFRWRAVRGGANYAALIEAGNLARLVAYPGHFLYVRDLGIRPVVE